MNGVMAQRPAEKVSGSFLPRVFSALVMAPLVLWAVHVGTPVFDVVVGAGALLLAREWSRLCVGRRYRAVMAVMMVALLAVIAVIGFVGWSWAPMAIAVGAASVFAGTHAGMRERDPDREKAPPWGRAWAAGGFVYIALVVVSLFWIRAFDARGGLTIYWLFACVWVSDSGAYAVGRLVGGPKLAPRISPKKTWAGFIGGTILSGVAGGFAAVLIGLEHMFMLAFASMGVAVVSQCGDLFESWMKRRFKVKDSGTLIPGHGGLLDRVDGLMAASVAVWIAGVFGGRNVLEWF